MNQKRSVVLSAWGVLALIIASTANAAVSILPTNNAMQDGSGNALTSTGNALDVNIKTPTTLPVSAASLPLPTGAATSAKQPALGAAGTPSSDVLTVQGATSMTPIKVDGSGVTQPVSGTFWQATQPVSGTVTSKLNDGAGTSVTVGSKTSANSLPVVIASDQAAFPVTMSPSFSTRSDTFTATASGTTVDTHTSPLKSFSLAVVATGAVTSWTVVLEGSLDNTNWTTLITHTNTSPGTGQIVVTGTSLMPMLYFRSRCTAITLGGGTNVVATILGM